MKVLFYLAELQSVEETRAKEEVFSLWSQVNEVEVVGVVSELNASNTLGEAGKGSILDILKMYDVDAVVVVKAEDLSNYRPQICAYVKEIRDMGVDVISVAEDLPKCTDCVTEILCNGREARRRAYHCTVKIFHE